MILDFDNIQETNYITTPGEYEFTVAKTEVKRSKKGNEMIEVTLKANAGEIKEYLPLQENTLFKFKQVAHAVGLNTAGVRLDINQFAQAISGRKLVAYVDIIQEPYTDPQTFEQKVSNKAVVKKYIKQENLERMGAPVNQQAGETQRTAPVQYVNSSDGFAF
jgi:hypothetical protein